MVYWSGVLGIENYNFVSRADIIYDSRWLVRSLAGVL